MSSNEPFVRHKFVSLMSMIQTAPSCRIFPENQSCKRSFKVELYCFFDLIEKFNDLFSFSLTSEYFD